MAVHLEGILYELRSCCDDYPTDAPYWMACWYSAYSVLCDIRDTPAACTPEPSVRWLSSVDRRTYVALRPWSTQCVLQYAQFMERQ